MSRELTLEEKTWCLEQAIAVVKEVGHGGASNLPDAASALQNVYQTLCALYQDIKGTAQGKCSSQIGLHSIGTRD